jgi:hypothetical protein
MKWVAASLILTAAIGCGDSHHGTKPAAGKGSPTETAILKPELLQPLLLAAKPDKALSVPDALAKADGETVIVSGVSPTEKVKPFNLALATFVLLSPEDAAKPEIKEEFECDDAPTCPRCRQVLEKHGVRVELVDAQGQVLPTSVEGFSGIKPGSPITIQGVVKREGKNNKLVRIVATRFYPG